MQTYLDFTHMHTHKKKNPAATTKKGKQQKEDLEDFAEETRKF